MTRQEGKEPPNLTLEAGCCSSCSSMEIRAKFIFCWLCIQVIFISVLSQWSVKVSPKNEALVTSCVVIPCTFSYPGNQLPASRVRGIWHKKGNRDEILYHEDSVRVVDNFKRRTRLLGDLGQKNCTLEIDAVKNHDDGPFCFRIEIPTLDKYSFAENCVTISMMSSPPQPDLQYNPSLQEGKPAVFRCSIKHTCISHPPRLTWSHLNELAIVHHKPQPDEMWEVESLLSFIPTAKDDHTQITCKASFHGGTTTDVTGQMFVKTESDKNVSSSIIIPVAAAVGTSILFGVVCIFMAKKYKRQIQELQSRNENGLWSRVSRMSQRFRSRYRRNTDINIPNRSNNHVSSASGSTEFSKPPVPSPHCDQKDYGKSRGGHSDKDDCNTYGNF